MGLRVGVLHDVLPADGGEVFAQLLRTGFDELCGAIETPRLDIVSVIADGAPRGNLERHRNRGVMRRPESSATTVGTAASSDSI